MANESQIALRLPADLLARLDRLAEQWRAERPGMRMTRSDVLRVLVLQALERAERIGTGAEDGAT